MSYDTLEPERVFQYFKELSSIPRCSGNEGPVGDYLLSVGNRLGLRSIKDDYGNVIIYKPGTQGKEDHPAVVLQGHMDMVCEKTENSLHDFDRDPLTLKIEDDFLTAEDTTLGADNGIALAMALALFEEDSLTHPPLELLITTNEEVGMDGAIGLSPTVLSGRRLINIDSEEEGTLVAGCAGGIHVTLSLNHEKVEIPLDPLYSIQVMGLQGGHSGMDIGLLKGNAILVLHDLLRKIKSSVPYQLVSINGGTKMNAIPRTAEAMIVIDPEDESTFLQVIQNTRKEIIDANLKREPDIRIKVKSCARDKELYGFDLASNDQMMKLIALLPSGVNTMVPGTDIVESSINFAKIETVDGKVIISLSLRSSNEDRRRELLGKIQEIRDLTGAESQQGGHYPAWQFKEHSSLREVMVKQYQNFYEKPMGVTVIHAGLECAIFAEKFPDMDMVSIGPNVYYAHTPQERLSISSTKRVYDYLKVVLENL